MKMCKCKKMSLVIFSTKEVSYECKCKKTYLTRKATKKEIKYMTSTMLENRLKMHEISHNFQKTFCNNTDLKFRYKGYDLMKRVDKWVKKYPEVKICRCDDSYFASSMLVFIPHQDKYQHWGLSIVYIPQCTGEEPIKFFFYPNHSKNVFETLQYYINTCRKMGNKNLAAHWVNSKEPKVEDIFPKSIKI